MKNNRGSFFTRTYILLGFETNLLVSILGDSTVSLDGMTSKMEVRVAEDKSEIITHEKNSRSFKIENGFKNASQLIHDHPPTSASRIVLTTIIPVNSSQ